MHGVKVEKKRQISKTQKRKALIPSSKNGPPHYSGIYFPGVMHIHINIHIPTHTISYRGICTYNSYTYVNTMYMLVFIYKSMCIPCVHTHNIHTCVHSCVYTCHIYHTHMYIYLSYTYFITLSSHSFKIFSFHLKT